MNISRTLSRTIAGAALVPALGVGILLGAGSASAHVSVTGSETAAGSASILTFSVSHGCDGSSTTQIAIQMPEGISSVTPQRQPFYEVEKKMETLAEPITDVHGNQITERVDQVIYTATTPLPDGQRDTFNLSVTLPDEEGRALAFPTIQTCEKGETAWTEIAAEGQDSHDLDSPAPTVVLTAAGDDGHGGGDSEANQTAADSNAGANEAAAGSDSDGGSDSAVGGLTIAALVAGVLGLLAGGAALLRARARA